MSERESWLTKVEVSRLLGVSKTTIWRLEKDKRLPTPKANPVSKRDLYFKEDIMNYLKSHNQ